MILYVMFVMLATVFHIVRFLFRGRGFKSVYLAIAAVLLTVDMSYILINRLYFIWIFWFVFGVWYLLSADAVHMYGRHGVYYTTSDLTWIVVGGVILAVINEMYYYIRAMLPTLLSWDTWSWVEVYIREFEEWLRVQLQPYLSSLSYFVNCPMGVLHPSVSSGTSLVLRTNLIIRTNIVKNPMFLLLTKLLP